VDAQHDAIGMRIALGALPRLQIFVAGDATHRPIISRLDRLCHVRVNLTKVTPARAHF
jgi:hypothetical protein